MNQQRDKHQPPLRILWSNPLNVSGQRGGGDRRFLQIAPGAAADLATFTGPSVITMLWLTLNWDGKEPYPRSRERNQAVRLRCYWEGSEQPAVDAPIGDFFGHLLGIDKPFENAWFDDPAGRSFRCWIPMPFRDSARIEIVNGFDTCIDVYHDIRLQRDESLAKEIAWFHAWAQRSDHLAGGVSHVLMPAVTGPGRYLGTHLGILGDQRLPLSWHAGNLSWFVDGEETPTYQSMTLDDYCGSAWDYDHEYCHQDSGLLFSRYHDDRPNEHGLYCYHRRDPLWFDDGCRAIYQPKAGCSAGDILHALGDEPALVDSIALPMSLDDLTTQARADEQAVAAGGHPRFLTVHRCDTIQSVAFWYGASPGIAP